MGIKEFGQCHRANISTLIELFSKRDIDGHLKNVIGVDASSVLMIRHLKSSENAQDCLHSEPSLPMTTKSALFMPIHKDQFLI
jgi:hypothetical protein